MGGGWPFSRRVDRVEEKRLLFSYSFLRVSYRVPFRSVNCFRGWRGLVVI